ncbi:hypothetical protein PSE10B_20100 [Pseudomonas amygdali pv. eriobotryae]|nr:hypothetical protein PSE10B_20100 [Pseudomonas amygdali pv. eriobotryae]
MPAWAAKLLTSAKTAIHWRIGASPSVEWKEWHSYTLTESVSDQPNNLFRLGTINNSAVVKRINPA